MTATMRGRFISLPSVLAVTPYCCHSHDGAIARVRAVSVLYRPKLIV